jgi:hypothetical protein
MPLVLKPRQVRAGIARASIIDTAARNTASDGVERGTGPNYSWMVSIHIPSQKNSCHAINMHEAIALSECPV